MIISATQRSASTIYCADLANKMNLKFGNDIIDGTWKGFSASKSSWHEYTGGDEATNFYHVINSYNNRDEYVILDHSANFFILQESSMFISRADLNGSCQSLHYVVTRRGGSQDMVNTVIELNLKRAFDFYAFCDHYKKEILWTDDLYKFRNSGTDSQITDMITKFVKHHNLSELVEKYKLIL